MRAVQCSAVYDKTGRGGPVAAAEGSNDVEYESGCCDSNGARRIK